MGFLRKLNKALLSFLVIANLHISFDHIIDQKSSLNNHIIELVLAQNKIENEAVDFGQLQYFYLLNRSVLSFNKRQDFQSLIRNYNLLEQLKYQIQKSTVLNLKPKVLKVVINEISIRKSHCI